MRNIVILLIFVLGCSCAGNSTLELNVPGVKSLDVTLICGEKQMPARFDSTGRVVFEWKLSEPEYCFLQFGSAKMRCYLEPGKSLVIHDQKPENRKAGERYRYEGDLARENQLLSDMNFYTTLRMKFTPETTLREVWDEIEKVVGRNLSRLDSMAKAQSLSPDFLSLERERVNYAGWSSYTRFNKWDPAIFDYLEPRLVSKPQLINMQEYMNFMENGIYVMGLRGVEQTDTYGQMANQVKFIRDHVGKDRVATALLEKSFVRHVEFNPGGVDEIDSLLGLLDYDFLVESPSFKMLYGEWALLKRGNKVPDFALEYRDGKIFSLQELRGKYVFIDCWASWCGPCRAEVPALKRLEEKYKGKNIAFVGKTGDNNKKNWIKALDELGLEGYQVSELAGSSQFNTFFKVNAIPRFILLDKEGNILRAVMSRPSDPATDAFLDKLDM